MDQKFPVEKVMRAVEQQVRGMQLPSVTKLSQRNKDPFIILVSTILSSRTKDEITLSATERLFQRITNPEELSLMEEHEIGRLIYPVGFYRTKAKLLKKMALYLHQQFQAKVPDTLSALLSLPGVGRKTANLVLSLGFGKQAICVDTHVHRITNRWGYVRTHSPHETEKALCLKLPPEWWITINTLLVSFGQSICRPLSPFCGRCSIEEFCKKAGVKRQR